MLNINEQQKRLLNALLLHVLNNTEDFQKMTETLSEEPGVLIDAASDIIDQLNMHDVI